MKQLHKIAYILLWTGGLNWGLYGLFGIDLVEMVLGPSSVGSLVYILVAASALFTFATHREYCNVCASTPKKSKKK